MDTSRLPEVIRSHLPQGYQSDAGVWLVLPLDGDPQSSIRGINGWIGAEDWYPFLPGTVIWFGDDRAGNFLGWRVDDSVAILWNPEDGTEPWRSGTVEELWAFVTNGYAA